MTCMPTSQIFFVDLHTRISAAWNPRLEITTEPSILKVDKSQAPDRGNGDRLRVLLDLCGVRRALVFSSS